MRLYFKYMRIHLHSQMQYRLSFLLLSIGQFFVPFLVFIGMYMLFQRFSSVGDWTLYEVALCYGVMHMAFALSECFARGLDSFSILVNKGDFDRILVRPRSTLLQVLGSKFDFSRIGRLLQSILILIYAISNLSVEWTLIKTLTLIIMILSATVIFASLFMLGATLCFWTIEGIEIINVVTDGGREMSQYPLDIYKDFVKKFFTFVIPFGTVNYLPLSFILGKTSGNPYIYMLIPCLGALFILPCIFLWSVGVKHYKSTGS